MILVLHPTWKTKKHNTNNLVLSDNMLYSITKGVGCGLNDHSTTLAVQYYYQNIATDTVLK